MVASCLHAAPPPDPTTLVFSNIQATSLALDWQGTTGTTIQFRVELASSGAIIQHSSDTFALSSTFTVLDVNAEFFARVIAIDTIDLSSSNWTTVISTYTLANVPVNLTTTSLSFNTVNLSWDGNSNPSGTVFEIERSTDGIAYGTIGSETSSTSIDSGITPGVTYTYRLRALNNLNVPTVYSNVIMLTIPGSASLPRVPTGFSVTRTQTGASTFAIDFTWHAVTERTDGTTLSNLDGYIIYTSTSLLTPRSQWVALSTEPVANWTTTSNGSITYYTLRTIDADGQMSDFSRVLDDSEDRNHFFFADDNVSRIQLPQSSADIFLRANNTYGADLDLVFTQVSAEETGRVAKSMTVSLLNYDTQTEITNPTFTMPILRGVLGYTVQGGVVVQGSPASTTARIPLISTGEAAEELSLFWFNGNEWVKTTGVVNTADNTMSFTAPRIGRFQIRAASHGTGATLTRVYPRIITPNGDGWNDKVVFEFDNPQLLPLTGKIYDLSNAFVAEAVPGIAADTTIVWDGKDESGKPVPGGIYLYQIDQGGEAASGTVVVAR